MQHITIMSRLCDLFLIFQLFILNHDILGCACTTINIPQGKIQGFTNYSENFNAYLGIPYATFVKRFQGPGPAPHWNGTLNAVNGSINCEQIDFITQKPTGQEDCLVLNVFTPLNNTKQLLPVLIFIPGGGFQIGINISDNYHPRYLLRKNIIVVSVNYRLGAFGFLCLQTSKVPGNAGLKDQLAAIKWVKNNIQYFGGDPQSITLSGQSAGAASISYLLLSSETKGLFQNVILASGSLLVPFAIDMNPVATASRVATKMGYNTKDPEQLAKIFQNSSSEFIITSSLFDDHNDPISGLVYRPCIDKSNGSLVKAGPRQLINSTSIDKNMNIIIGYDSMEGMPWAAQFDAEGLKNLSTNFSKIIPGNIIFANETEKTALVNEVKNFYFKNQTYDSFYPLVDYYSDTLMMYPAVAATQYFLRSNVTIYNYYFQYDSKRNLGKNETTLAYMKGACHADDMDYIFDPAILRSSPVISADATIIDAMTSFYANLTKAGNPSTKKITWKPSTNTSALKFLSIDKKIEMISQPNAARIKFWQAICKKYNCY